MPIESYKGRPDAARARVGILPAKYRELHTAPHVNSAVRVAEHQGKRVANEPAPRIATLLDVLSDRYQNPKSRDALIEHLLVKRESFPNGGNVDAVRRGQHNSLKHWVDHLADPDTEYPDWFKYYVFHSVTSMGRPEANRFSFKERSANTRDPFPELNVEALDKAYRVIAGALDETIDPDSRLRQLSPDTQFGRIYMVALSESDTVLNPDIQETTQGEWRVFKQAHGAALLERAKEHADSLNGKLTEWCTTMLSDAEKYLKHGDLQILYTNDKDGNPTIPRVAIVTKFGRVTEVRGVLLNEEIEPALIDQTVAALQGMPGAERFIAKAKDIKRLGEIRDKNYMEDLTTEELRFVYQIDRNVGSFTNGKSPLIDEILRYREEEQDLAQIFDCRVDQVVTMPGQMREDTVVLMGDYKAFDPLFTFESRGRFGPRKMEVKYPLPPSLRYISGNMDLGRFEGKTLGKLEAIGGDLKVREAPKLSDLGELFHIGGSGNFYGPRLRSTGKVNNVGGDVVLGPSIQNTELEEVGGNCAFGGSQVERVTIKRIGGTAVFEGSKVTVIDGLEEVGGASFYRSDVRSTGTIRIIHGEGDFRGTDMDFDRLEWIGGDASFDEVKKPVVGNLKVVGGKLELPNSQITDMPALTVVGDGLDAKLSQLRNIPSLAYIGGDEQGIEGSKVIDTETFLALTAERQLGPEQSVDDIVDFDALYGSHLGGPGTPRRGDVLEKPQTSQGREVTVFPDLGGAGDPFAEGDDVPLAERQENRTADPKPQRPTKRQGK